MGTNPMRDYIALVPQSDELVRIYHPHGDGPAEMKPHAPERIVLAG